MVKKILLCVCAAALCVSPLFSRGKSDNVTDERQREVVIYTYDSFISEWGPGPELIRLFEEQTGYTCTMLDVGDGAQVLSRAVLEKDSPQADVVIGIDNNLLNQTLAQDILIPYKPAGIEELIDEWLLFDKSWHLIPYDWSNFAIIFDTQSGLPAPDSLSDLIDPIYAKKLILMDPRTSTPGLGFVAWTVAVFGQDYLEFWKALKPNILTMAPGWSSGYGLFTSGEAPLVISYTTSPAYHLEYGEGNRFQALIFDEGHPYQIEGAGIIKGAANIKGAQAFIDFLISAQAQNVLPLTQWMYPVNREVELPASYAAGAPVAHKQLSADSSVLTEAVETVMQLLAE